MSASRPRTGASSSPSLFPTRDPDILDLRATAQRLGISTHAVYTLFKKGELPRRKVARRWLTTRELVMGWLNSASEQDTLARAIANGDQNALTTALKSGKSR
jgi:predicted DNA-binding transcriptional regulator AlpA